MQKGLPAKQYKSQNKQLPSCQLQLVSGHYKADVEHAGKNTKSPSLAEGKTYPPVSVETETLIHVLNPDEGRLQLGKGLQTFSKTCF